MEMKKWSNKLKRVTKEQKGARGRNINLAIVSAKQFGCPMNSGSV